MPIDKAALAQPGSDEWWMQKCWLELKAKRKRLTMLENYRRGTPEVVLGTAKLQSTYYRFQQQARVNVADLVVQALVERLRVRNIRTAASSDDEGDEQATNMLESSGLIVALSDALRMLATYGESGLSASAPAAAGEWAQFAAEDPRDCVVVSDARGYQVAFKLFHEPLTGYDYAILWRPGQKIVAWSEKGTRPLPEARDKALQLPKISFVPSRFDIRPVHTEADEADASDPMTPLWSEDYEVKDLPISWLEAPDCVGVFERHLDAIDQINHTVLQAMVIATLQAFRQRAIKLKEKLPEHDPKTGEKINWDDVFSADPAALWELPLGAEIWESGTVDMSGVNQMIKDGLQRFASTTRTPFSMFVSDAINQSAQGAQLAREGLVFKAEDFQGFSTLPILRNISVGFKFMPDDVRYAEIGGKQVDRAELSGMSIDWLPAERYSLAERTQADSQSSLPLRQKYARFYGMTPKDVDLAMAQKAEDALLGLTEKTPAQVPATGDVPATGG